jgi:threonyl-tRNA synthetase
VHGLTRARGFTQDDAHIFCTPEQLAEELASLLDFVVGLLRDFGLTEFEAELSTRPEQYVGEFPPWLAPVQVVGIPIADTHVAYLQKVSTRLREHGIRVEVDDGADRMQKKIRTAQRQKVPYMLLAGDEDVAAGAVSFRYRSGEQKNGVPVDEAVAEIVAAVADRVQV